MLYLLQNVGGNKKISTLIMRAMVNEIDGYSHATLAERFRHSIKG